MGKAGFTGTMSGTGSGTVSVGAVMCECGCVDLALDMDLDTVSDMDGFRYRIGRRTGRRLVRYVND